MSFTRRSTALLLSAAIFAAALSASPAAAKDGGGSSGGSGSSGSSGSGSSGSGSNSGSGGSGHDGGDDHGGHGGGDDDGGGDDHGGRGTSSGSGSGRADYDRARDAVREGRILPLKSLLQKIDSRRYGRVIDVSLSRSLFSDVYQLKLRDGKGTIRTLRVDARSGEVIGDK
ncbi:hypothetical protein [Rhizobium sp. BE258]|jgi:hypothetical protein|uniref:PepSY domain-containing protein n=1 Tax=Rhizobium sp. BE258 TaxID=2817722 RepID=UPI002862192C|nr:hypothetical protein [Rhizobium sp. BE258]MDR7143717.1 hypothetical protein [Rhizobium sp. BE258]